MVKRMLVLALLLSLFRLPQMALAATELWSVNTCQFPWRENAKLMVIPELRFSEINGLYLFQTYLGPGFALNKTWTANFFYTPKFTKSGDQWNFAHTGYADLIFQADRFSNRSRLEEDSTNGTLKYRDQLQYKLGSWAFSDELFYNFKKGLLDENRLAAGYSLKITEKFDLILGGMLRSQKATVDSDWQNTNVVMVNSSAKF